MRDYCEATYRTKRWKTREVRVGNVGVGGTNPIRIQSMTTSDTRDAAATAAQIMRLADTGCEIARVTVQGMKEADACEEIKNTLICKGYTIPLVADIHFYPPAALRVADFADKVRINPGNFVDKRASFKVIEYDDASYAKEIERIEEKFTPLIEKCKKLKRALRIGTNHGSLSDRIMNRYGDTPKGMVESALEFTRVCRKNDYHDIIFSMKASNPLVMIQAYRLLVAEMRQLGWDYPLHLGVTEAGNGEDGRIKSSIGIGALLLDGLGDTIRVSLTEDPWDEIDPCKRLVHYAATSLNHGIAPFTEKYRKIDVIERRPITTEGQLPLHRDGSVVVTISSSDLEGPSFFTDLDCHLRNGKWVKKPSSPDAILLTEPCSRTVQEKLQTLSQIGIGIFSLFPTAESIPVFSLEQAQAFKTTAAPANKLAIAKPLAIRLTSETSDQWEALLNLKPSLLFFSPPENRLHLARKFFDWLQEHALNIPVILAFDYLLPQEDLLIQASAEIGALLGDSLGEGVCINGPYTLNFRRLFGFNLLQGCRMRSFKTDFISCPGCGRTLFDLQAVTKRIQQKTKHLAGVKIAIMGCIVNGPGEMADADFGYVGSKPHKVDLYVGKTCVQRDIDFDIADEALVELIKAHGRWIEPEQEAQSEAAELAL